MAIDKSLLGPNQLTWLDIQEQLRKTYPWHGKDSQVPDEHILEVLKGCRVSEFNTNCFTEGVCLDPSNPKCPKRVGIEKG